MLPILETNYNNPPFDTSNPAWAGQLCRNMTAISKENAASANPIQEWTPVLSPGDELSGDVGVSGWAHITTKLRSEEHTSELQSHSDLVCRLLLEKKKKTKYIHKETQTSTQHAN